MEQVVQGLLNAGIQFDPDVHLFQAPQNSALIAELRDLISSQEYPDLSLVGQFSGQ
jgi:hypothetical protein